MKRDIFLPMSEATRQALFNPLSTSPRDLNRLSPALRKKHLMQLHRKRRTPSSSHPYDLYIISAPLSRGSNNMNNPGRSLIRSLRSDINHSPLPSPFIHTDPITEKDDEEEDYAYSKIKLEEMDELDTDSDTNTNDLLSTNNHGVVSELYKLVTLCNQTVNYYKELARKQDLSPHIDTLITILSHNESSNQSSVPVTK
jgi:hypothetical protein